MKREPQDVSEGSAEPRQIQPASVFRGPFVALMLRCGRHCWQATSCDNYPNRIACRRLSFYFIGKLLYDRHSCLSLLASDLVVWIISQHAVRKAQQEAIMLAS